LLITMTAGLRLSRSIVPISCALTRADPEQDGAAVRCCGVRTECRRQRIADRPPQQPMKVTPDGSRMDCASKKAVPCSATKM
jgi:hypothetical protein